MLYEDLGFEIEKSTKMVVLYSDIVKLLEQKGISMKVFRDSLKEGGWSGSHRKVPVKFYPEPHFTKLSHKSIPAPEPIYSKIIVEDTSELVGKPVYNILPKFKKCVEEPLSESYRFCFYDVEATFDNAFAGLKLEGYEFTYVPIYRCYSVMESLHNHFKNSDRPVIFVAYNDTYDGHMILYSSGVEKDLAHYRNLSTKIISNIGAYNNYKELKSKIDTPLVAPEDMRYNPLQGNFLTFDAQAELFKIGDLAKGRVINSLKYHALKAGLEWVHDIKSDVFIYNKEDVMHLSKLFVLHGGAEVVSILVELAKFSRTTPKIFSSKLLLGIFRKYAFPDGMLVEKFLNSRHRLAHIQKEYSIHGISERIAEDTQKNSAHL